MIKQPVEKHCFFCVNQIKTIDWKDIVTLTRFMSHYCRIVPRRKTGLCAKHQRKITKLIKRAREMGELPFVRK